MIYDHDDCDHSDHDEHRERMVFDSSENAYKLGPYCCKDTWITMVAWALIKSQLRAASSLAVGFRPQVLEAHKSNKVNKIPSLEWPFGRFLMGEPPCWQVWRIWKSPQNSIKLTCPPQKGPFLKSISSFKFVFELVPFPFDSSCF